MLDQQRQTNRGMRYTRSAARRAKGDHDVWDVVREIRRRDAEDGKPATDDEVALLLFAFEVLAPRV